MISSSKIFLSVFILASFFLSCSERSPSDKNQSSETKKDEMKHPDSAATALYPSESEKDSSKVPSYDSSIVVSVKTFQENSQWGYDIFIGDKPKPKLYIHQPHIPSVPGNSGFKTEEDARKTGEFIEYKIKHHIMPPSVTPEELDSMGVWKKQK